MTTVNSYKPLEQAIMNGENTIKVDTPKFLVACAVAEKCKGLPDNIKAFLDLLVQHKNKTTRDYSSLYYPIVNDKGKTFQIRLTISLCADAIKIMGILNKYGVGLQTSRNGEGAMTGEMQIICAR